MTGSANGFAAARERRDARRDRGLALIAAFKLVKAVLLFAVGFGALELLHAELAGGAQQLVAGLTPGVDRRLVEQVLARVSGLSPGRLEAVGVGAFLFATLFTVEGIGLWWERRWAEYLTVIGTASLVPFEVYELVRRYTLPRGSALMLNLALVAYLTYRLRSARERG